MRNIIKYYKIWLPLFSIVLFFSLAELICREFDLTDKFDADFKFYIHNVASDLGNDFIVEDAFLMWFPKPNYSDAHIKINSQGFRDKEYKVTKDKNVFRILCLGDSSTFGLGVPIHDTYHALLENRLNKELGQSGKKFEIINAGVPGYTSCQGLALYKYRGVKYTPDVVTFYFGFNDANKIFYLSDKQIMQNDVPFVVKAINNTLLLKLDSYRLLRKCIANITANGNNNVGESVPRVSIEDFKANILELNRLCKKNGALLLLIAPHIRKEENFYFIRELNRKKYAILYRKELEKISKEYNIPLVSVTEMTEESPSDTTLLFLDTVHPSQFGHWLIMVKLYDRLKNMLITNGNP
jgi:lysophospholipase L1-like esterase